MSTRVQRILLILFMIAAEVFTVYNYANHKTDLPMLIACTALIGFLLFGQISALIREWDK